MKKIISCLSHKPFEYLCMGVDAPTLDITCVSDDDFRSEFSLKKGATCIWMKDFFIGGSLCCTYDLITCTAVILLGLNSLGQGIQGLMHLDTPQSKAKLFDYVTQLSTQIEGMVDAVLIGGACEDTYRCIFDVLHVVMPSSHRLRGMVQNNVIHDQAFDVGLKDGQIYYCYSDAPEVDP